MLKLRQFQMKGGLRAMSLLPSLLLLLLLLNQLISPRLFLLVSIAPLQTTTCVQMARTPETSLRTDPRPRSMLPRVVDLLWVTSLVDQVVTETDMPFVSLNFVKPPCRTRQCIHPFYINNGSLCGFCDVI